MVASDLMEMIIPILLQRKTTQIIRFHAVTAAR